MNEWHVLRFERVMVLKGAYRTFNCDTSPSPFYSLHLVPSSSLSIIHRQTLFLEHLEIFLEDFSVKNLQLRGPMNLGIDLGSVKTTMYSTKDNGKPVTDEFHKSEISTVIERPSEDVRVFGNSVSGAPKTRAVRRSRGFLANILNPDCQEDLLMFLNFLDRTIKLNDEYKDACLTIPEFFGEEEKRMLKAVVEISDLKVTQFMTHLTAVAACAALRNFNINEEFVIIDCGYSKTSMGAFKFVQNKLTPLKRWHIKRGAADFDEAVYSILIKKYGLQDDANVREKIFQEVKTIKRGLNTLDLVKTHILSDSYDPIHFEITKDEYLSAIAPVLSELEKFFESVASEYKLEKKYIEVVGNNSNNVYIQKLLEKMPYSTTLDTTESASLGACLALAVNSRKAMGYAVEEIVGINLYVKVEGEGEESKLLISGEAPLTGKDITTKFKRKAGFNVQVIENSKVIGVVRINKPASQEAEQVTVTFKITPFMTLEVVSVAASEPLQFTYETFEANKDVLEKIRAVDAKFAKAENEKKAMEKMRNDLENLLDSFDGVIQRVFPGLITSEVSNEIDKVRNDFFDSQPVATTLAEEEKVKSDVMSSLSFINDKLKAVETTIREEGEAILKTFDTKTKELLKVMTPEANKLHNTVYRLRGYLQTLKLDIENVRSFDQSQFGKLKSDIERETKTALAEEKRREKEEEIVAKRAAEDKAKGSAKSDAKGDAEEKTDDSNGDQKKPHSEPKEPVEASPEA